ncbi:TPA: hypothetical protein ACHSMM_004514 [Yersinia enterocolitica]
MAINSETLSLHFRCGSVAVNDVFASSWGYEQTNVNFYQVIAVRGKKTAILREIRAAVVNYDHSMVGNKKPVPNDFIGEAITRRICDRGGEIAVKIEDYEQATKTRPDELHRFTSYA